MRTTLVIDDQLFRKAKAQAARRGITLSELVAQALRSQLVEPAAQHALFVMPTYGQRGTHVHHEPGDFALTQDEFTDKFFLKLPAFGEALQSSEVKL